MAEGNGDIDGTVLYLGCGFMSIHLSKLTESYTIKGTASNSVLKSTSQNKAGMAIIKSDKVSLRQEYCKWKWKWHFILIKINSIEENYLKFIESN